MKVTLESTTRLSRALGAECRIWTGATEGGVPVIAYIALVAVPEAENQEQFERELKEVPAITPAIDLRLVL